MKADKPDQIDQAGETDARILAVVEKLDPGFGAVLIEQLVRRIDNTVDEFNSEFEELVSRLADNFATQEELTARIRKRDDVAPEEEAAHVPEDDGEEGLTEWEKRLAKLEKPSD